MTDPSDPAASRRAEDIEPNMALWEALERGPRLRHILTDFYSRVYADPRLAPFFVHTSIDWVIDHQFAFLAQAFGGQQLYFGDRPRNAHHWMVISDELFDYREALMETTLRDHGLRDEDIAHWRSFEERFRSHIVKSAPFPKKRRGIALPLDGFGTVTMDDGGICDGCQAIIDRGTSVEYHLRTGKAYCERCRSTLAGDPAT